jgi:hypothetical protein
MDGLVCDGCGEGLLLAGDVRYVLRIEGFAAYDPMEITHQDLEKDLEAEMEGLLERLSRLDPEAAQDQVHRAFQFDLCPGCWSRFLKDPLLAARGSGVKGEGPSKETTAAPPEDKKKSQGD